MAGKGELEDCDGKEAPGWRPAAVAVTVVLPVPGVTEYLLYQSRRSTRFQISRKFITVLHGVKRVQTRSAEQSVADVRLVFRKIAMLSFLTIVTMRH